MIASPNQHKYSSSGTESFLKMVRGFGFRFYIFLKLPAAWFSGVKLKEIDYDRTEVTVRYRWTSQNPFRSTYFACLAMAAEMSTGLPCLMAIRGGEPAVSMLVVGMESGFFKKAVGTTTFVCLDNPAIFECIRRARLSGESESIIATSSGYDEAGEEIARFKITWSFRVRK